jgi:hypothetical protein
MQISEPWDFEGGQIANVLKSRAETYPLGYLSPLTSHFSNVRVRAESSRFNESLND